MILEIIPRKWRRNLALLFFILAVAFAIPPTIPFGEIWTDIFLNLPLATYLSTKFGFKMLTSLLLTYTLIPILLLYIGAFIYPADTTKTFNGQFTKIKNFFIKYINLIKKNPIHLVWLFIGIYILWRFLGFYQTQINIYILS